jgi:hypothetical protein
MDIEKDDRESNESGVERRLALESDLGDNGVNSGTGAGAAIPMIMDGRTKLDDDTTVEDLKDRSKHTKKAGASSPSLESVGSFEQPVRSQ